jgi:hypothetical protein
VAFLFPKEPEMPDPNEPRNTLRDVLSAKLDAAETVETPVVDTPIDPPQETEAQREERLRDEKGRFARAEQEQAPVATPEPTQAPVQPQATPAPVAKLTTWRKEFLPIQDKLAQGLPLTAEEAKKLSDYNVQREKEYATGVSTYKAEAQNAKELQDALTPFMPELQANNIRPAQWIHNLGNAHLTLVRGSPEQKIQMFAHLAQQYGVPLAAVAAPQGQLDPIVPQLMQHIQNLESKVNTVTGWREQQEQQQLQNEISKFQDAEKFPHFEAVRGDMAQLLESGVAKNLDDAYERAVYMNSETRQAEIERQAREHAEQLAQARQAENNVAAAKQAKARAVSTKTTTPSGTAVNSGPKDRRASLVEKFDAMTSGRV